MAIHYGGHFAPPFTAELMTEHKTRIDALPASDLKEKLEELYACCVAWRSQPKLESGISRPHPAGVGTITDLHPDVAAALDEHIPWPERLADIQATCDRIPADQKSLRFTAFHLLWHIKKLARGWEPCTNDMIGDIAVPKKP